MFIIFLDMDGVMNTSGYLKDEEPSKAGTATLRIGSVAWYARQVDPKTVQRLNQIIAATKAKVVISSSWRQHNSPETMQRILDIQGFKGEVIGQTPFARDLPEGIRRLDGSRGQEISVWLVKNTHLQVADNFVILDDMNPRAFAHLAPYLVQTSWHGGLLDPHVEDAIRILKHGPDTP